MLKTPLPKPKAARINLFQRLWLELSEVSLSPLSAVTVCLVLAQTGLIAALLLKPAHNALVSPSESEQWRWPAPVAAKEGPVLRMTFKSTASEGEIRYLLIKDPRQPRSAFPGTVGQLLGGVPPGAWKTPRRELSASRIIESVDLVPDGAVER